MSETGNVIGPAATPDAPVVLGGRLSGISLTRQIIALSLWPFLQNILGSMVSLADRVIAGKTIAEGSQSAVFDALGLAMYVAWLMMILQGAIATGAQALVARAFGARNQLLAERSTAQSVMLGLLGGVISGVIIFCAAPQLAAMFDLHGQAGIYARQYLRILAISAPFSAIVFVCNACQRAGGDTRTPFIAMLAVNVVNVGLSILLMKTVMQPEAMSWTGEVHGISGLAWGSVGGWVIGAALILYSLIPRRKHDPVVSIHREHWIWDWKVSQRILRVGMPQLVEVLGMWGIHAFGVWLIANKLTTDGMLGAHGMIVQIESLSFMPGFALGMAASTLAGQYLGAGSKEMAVRSVGLCWVVAVVVMGLAGVGLVLFSDELVGIMTTTSGPQAKLAAEVIGYVGYVQPFFATALVLKMAMRGAGATNMVMGYSFTIMLVIRMGGMWGAFQLFGEKMSLQMVWGIMAVDLIVQSVVFSFLHFRGKWLDAEV